MVSKIISKGKKLFLSPQTTVLSAATIIMFMVITSRALGLVRQRILAHFFAPDQLSLFFAAFRLPDLIFEALIFGAFSSAFIPVFTKALRNGRKEAWEIAASVSNFGLIIFIALAVPAGIFANKLYSVFAPGFSSAERSQIVTIARLLFAAQGFFVISYVLTGVLESLKRFLVPALAPLLYNVGIILGTIFLVPKIGLLAPAVGVFVGAMAHLLIQLPLAVKLGFRVKFSLRLTEEVKKIGRLAAPRVLELSFLQVSKTAELFLASLISTAAYTYYTFGNSIQLLPVGLFGTSIAKAALPTLARFSEAKEEFKKTLLSALYQIIFLALPVSIILVVLRIPVVRLAFGTEIFGWEATVQTGMVVSAFAVGIVFQATTALLARAFYAIHDTKTPVFVSVGTITATVIMDFILIRGFQLPVWGLAAAFSIGSFLQTIILFHLLNRKVINEPLRKVVGPVFKPIISAFLSGVVMFFILKFFDRSVWVKRLSFLGKVEAIKFIPFERFVLDTRYTLNLLILTVMVAVIGGAVYLVSSMVLKSEELLAFLKILKKTFVKRKVSPIPKGEEEVISPPPTETT